MHYHDFDILNLAISMTILHGAFSCCYLHTHKTSQNDHIDIVHTAICLLEWHGEKRIKLNIN